MTTLPEADPDVAITVQDVRKAVLIIAGGNPTEAAALAVAGDLSMYGAPIWHHEVASRWFASLAIEYPLTTAGMLTRAAHAAACKSPGILLASLCAELRTPHMLLSLELKS